MARRYEIDMCNGKLFSGIVRCAIPLMLTNILQLLYNAVDIIVVGRYVGSDALAAVGSTTSLINMIVNIFLGLSVGATVVVAQYIGSKNYQKAHDGCHTAILTSIILGIFLAILGNVLCRPMLLLMGSPGDVIEQSVLYMRIYFLGMPAFMVMTFGSALMRTVGDTKRPLYFFSISGVLNVILNLIFVLKFKLGVAGVAIATIISQYVSAIFIMAALVNTDGYIKIDISSLKIDKSSLSEMVKKGLPAGIQSFVFSGSNVIIQSSINSFGSTVMAGSSAASNIEGFVYTALNTFYHVAISFSGQNFGAKKYNRIDKTLLISLSLVIVIGVIASTVVYMFGETLLGIYAPGNAEAINYGMTRFRCILLPYFICGIMEVFVGTIRGIGSSIIPMLISILGVCGVRIMWIFTVFAHHRTLETLFVSYLMSWSATICCLVIAYFILRKKLFKKESH